MLIKEVPTGLTLNLVQEVEHPDMQAPMGCTSSSKYFFIGCKGIPSVVVYTHDGQYVKHLNKKFTEPIGMTGEVFSLIF